MRQAMRSINPGQFQGDISSRTLESPRKKNDGFREPVGCEMGRGRADSGDLSSYSPLGETARLLGPMVYFIIFP